jgi:hypothetical protein
MSFLRRRLNISTPVVSDKMAEIAISDDLFSLILAATHRLRSEKWG